MPTVFVTGMSGTGKSSALAELGRRGHRVVDTDSHEWSEWFPADGEWRWREDRIAGLLAAEDGRLRYLCGCQSNQGVFYDRFAAVVLMSAPLEVILERVEARMTNDYGKGPQERADIVQNLSTIEPLLRATCTHEIDAARPLADVVAQLEEIGRAAAAR
jgi:predicted ATPase